MMAWRTALMRVGTPNGTQVDLVESLWRNCGESAMLIATTMYEYGESFATRLLAPYAAGLWQIRFDDLKHTFASLIIANGEDIARVSPILGDASPTTLKVYSPSGADSRNIRMPSTIHAMSKIVPIVLDGVFCF
jgi:integrase